MKSWVGSLTFLVLGVMVLSIAQPVAAYIEYWAYIVPTPGFTDDNRVREPINLVFWWEGDAADVNDHFNDDLDNAWGSCVFASNKYAFVEDSHFGGHSEKWELQDYHICVGGALDRYHIRIFDGYYDTHTRRHWSIASVHYEVTIWCWLIPCGHRVTDWEGAETYVRDDFADESFVASIQLWYLGNSGYFGAWDPQPFNNGYATAIELTS